MEYYAKSKERELSGEEKRKLKNMLQNMIEDLGSSLKESEERLILSEIEKIDERKNQAQKTLTEHLDDIVKCAESFFTQYGKYFTEKEKALVIEACRIHDIGKVNLLFQARVSPVWREKLTLKQRNTPQIPHGFLSALSLSKDEFCKLSDEFKKEDFNAFLTAVYYHHAREDEYESDEIKKYSDKYYSKYIKEYLERQEWKLHSSYMGELLFRKKKDVENKNPEKWKWNQYVLVKGMLNKFDYVVSAGYEEAEINPDLREKFLVNQIGKTFQKTGLRPVQQYMAENRDKNLIIVAPTGSGKTEAALLWLNGEKGFYTLPLKVSSNAIYKRIEENYDYKSVALLHSDSLQKYIEKSTDTESGGYEKYERAKLLSYPLTVCTVDQLFKFVYRTLGTEIFAATLKYSKLILDEIQAYSPRVIATIIYGLEQITKMGGKFAIITATFPPVLRKFMEDRGLIEGEQYEFCDFSSASTLLRHKIKIMEGEIDLEEVIERAEEKKILIICNTVTKAQSIFEQLSEQMQEVYLLHSRYIRRDREQLEKKIMMFSEDKDTAGIWVTTQIVEASLDIDFDILYTEMCTADSLLQRMGRCNRKGRYLPQEANVIICDNESGVGKRSVYEPFLYDRSLEYLYPYEGKVFSEKEKIEYINQVYCTEEIRESDYYKEIQEYIKHFESISPLEYSQRETNEQFRNIQSVTVVPDSIYNENQEVFETSMELLQKPHIGKEVRSILTSKIYELTLSLNCYYGRLPQGVDRDVVGGNRNYKMSGIHRTRLKYEFDQDTGQGRGLILDSMEEEDFLI